MSTKFFAVQHEWDSTKAGDVVPAVSKVVESAASGKLPTGLDLRAVMLSKEAPKAYCVWETESRESLEGLLESINPPTRHTVSEFGRAYGMGR